MISNFPEQDNATQHYHQCQMTQSIIHVNFINLCLYAIQRCPQFGQGTSAILQNSGECYIRR